MRSDKSLAYQLRLEGKSYKEISRKLFIPLSTLSYWFSSDSVSNQIKLDLNKSKIYTDRIHLKKLSILKRQNHQNEIEKVQDEAIILLPVLMENPLFVTGLMLYWGEGDKVLKNGLVRLSNTDPELIKTFLKFLLELMEIDIKRIRVQVILYPDLNPVTTVGYWSSFLGLPLTHFHKSALIQGKTKNRHSEYGICVLGVSDTKLKLRILTWLSVFPSILNTKVIV